MRVFLSSTYSDLRQHREVLMDTLRRMGEGIDLLAMEYFGSDPRNAIQLSTQKVSEADLYVGVFGLRYGAIDKPSKMSITEVEYRTALAKRLPVLLYLTSEEYPVDPRTVDTGRSASKIRKLRKEIEEHHVTQRFSTPEDLGRRVAADLARLLRNSPLKSKPKQEALEGPVGPEINPSHPYLLSHVEKPSAIEGFYNVKLYVDLYLTDVTESTYERYLKRIDRVVYQLHESFIVPVIPMQNWKENFLLEMHIMGGFWVRATIWFKDKNKDPVMLDRFINLGLEGTLLEN